MVPMSPLCYSSPMFMPRNSGMIGIPPMMVPMLPGPLHNINLCPSRTITNEYDSHMYGRFRHVERDDPQYRHTPFDWYRPPEQQHHVVHEDTASVDSKYDN